VQEILKMTTSNKKIQSILLTLFLTLAFCGTKAQTNMAFYPLEDQFNSSGYNPAFLYSDSQFMFSLFPLAGVNLGYNNTDVIRTLSNKLLKGINTNEEYLDIVKTMVRKNSYNQRLESDLLNFTVRTTEGFFNFRIRENVLFSASVKGPVSGFMILPEYRSVEVGLIQNVPLLIMHYREYSIGYSSPMKQQDFSWGARAKLYYGKGVFSSDISGSIENVADFYYFKTYGYGKMSMPEEKNGALNFTTTSISDYLFNSQNSGVGFDLGFRYRLNPQISFTFSVLDLGNINWKNNLASKDFRSIPSPVDSVSSKIENGVEIITKIGDSISFTSQFKDVFRTEVNQLPFKTALPVTYYFGSKYQLNKKVSFNFVDRFTKLKSMNHNSMMFSTGLNLSSKFAMNAGFEVIDEARFNIPVALLFRREFGQAYIGTDNLIGFLNPSSADFSGLTFGLSFYLFRKRNLYSDPNENYPFHKPKKVRKVMNSGRIQKEYTDFGFPEQY